MFWRMTIAALIFLSTLLPATVRAQDYAIRPQFENVGHFHDGIAPAMRGGLWGFVDVAGNWVVQPQFDAVKAGADRRFGVLQRGRWGYLNTAGQMVIRPRFQEAGRFSEGYAAVSEDGRWYFVIDADGKDTLDGARLPQISEMRDGLATVQTNWDDWSALPRGSAAPVPGAYMLNASPDLQGGSQAEIDDLTPFSEGLAFMLHAGKYRVLKFNQYSVSTYFVMPDGTRYIDDFPAFQAVRRFSEGLAAVSVDGVSWGFIDGSAQFVIPPQFEGAREFTQGVAPVKLNGLWGYVDRAGRVVFPPTYDRAYSFREGFATIRQGDLRGFLQMDGAGRITPAYPPQFEDVFSFQEGLAPVKVSGLWGFIKVPGLQLRVLPPVRQETALKTLRP